MFFINVFFGILLKPRKGCVPFTGKRVERNISFFAQGKKAQDMGKKRTKSLSFSLRKGLNVTFYKKE